MLLSPQFSATGPPPVTRLTTTFKSSILKRGQKLGFLPNSFKNTEGGFKFQVLSREKHTKKPQSKSKNLKKMEGGGEGEVEMVVDSKDLQQQSKAFDKLTDRVEDRQLNSTRVQEAMASIAASSEADRNAMRLREKELAAVKINAGDVDIIANELELDKKVAERTLREHKGDAVAAIRHLLR